MNKYSPETSSKRDEKLRINIRYPHQQHHLDPSLKKNLCFKVDLYDEARIYTRLRDGTSGLKERMSSIFWAYALKSSKEINGVTKEEKNERIRFYENYSPAERDTDTKPEITKEKKNRIGDRGQYYRKSNTRERSSNKS